ncbi:hypothetical protein ACFQL7_04580 [Halocatena marina]|uniref:Uncharacterized protein n=1 Tax=Halocatena marina TaxID=2934937 RepID=A0ABD5YRW9_9EURY
MDGFGDSLNAAEWVTSRLESEDVSHAEVGCVMKESTEGRVTLAELEPGTEHSQNAVWWRVFVEGSADYRFTTSLEESHLADLVGRSIQSARLLDQHTPARYDQERPIKQCIRDGLLVDRSATGVRVRSSISFTRRSEMQWTVSPSNEHGHRITMLAFNQRC